MLVEMEPDTIFRCVKKCFGKLYDPLKFTFDLSLEKKIFLDDLKIARFNPVFIGSNRSRLGTIDQYQSSHAYNT